MYILVDKFRGKLSDFADEDVYSVFRSRLSAVREFSRRFTLLISENPDQFECCDKIHIAQELFDKGKCEITSHDGCVYSWRIARAV